MDELIITLERSLPVKRRRSERAAAVEETAIICDCGEDNVNAVLRGAHKNEKVIEVFYPLYQQKLEDAISKISAARAQVA